MEHPVEANSQHLSMTRLAPLISFALPIDSLTFTSDKTSHSAKTEAGSRFIKLDPMEITRPAIKHCRTVLFVSFLRMEIKKHTSLNILDFCSVHTSRSEI